MRLSVLSLTAAAFMYVFAFRGVDAVNIFLNTIGTTVILRLGDCFYACLEADVKHRLRKGLNNNMKKLPPNKVKRVTVCRCQRVASFMWATFLPVVILEFSDFGYWYPAFVHYLALILGTRSWEVDFPSGNAWFKQFLRIGMLFWSLLLPFTITIVALKVGLGD